MHVCACGCACMHACIYLVYHLHCVYVCLCVSVHIFGISLTYTVRKMEYCDHKICITIYGQCHDVMPYDVKCLRLFFVI